MTYFKIFDRMESPKLFTGIFSTALRILASCSKEKYIGMLIRVTPTGFFKQQGFSLGNKIQSFQFSVNETNFLTIAKGILITINGTYGLNK